MTEGAAVPEGVAKSICEILSSHPNVRRAVLFGSRAKGNFREGSDIDLALEGEGLDERELSRLIGEFDDAPIAHRVDILLKDKIDHPALLEHIERVGRVFYERG
jgi:predicted nucleotidyltransferase